MVDAPIGMNYRPSTVRDVAKLAGVSVATVSRVLNGLNVSFETRAKVLSAVSRLQYRPNEHAIKLARAKGDIDTISGIKMSSSAATGRKVLEYPGTYEEAIDSKLKRLHLIEEENVRLMQMVTNLSIEVNTLRGVGR